MTPLQYVSAIGRFWYLVVLGVVLGVIGATAVAAAPATAYRSSAAVLVSATPLGNQTQATAYTTNLYAQGRMATFLGLAEGPTLEEEVLAESDLDLSAAQLRSRLEITVPTDSTVLSLTVTDDEADRAEAIATAASEAMVRVINRQENRRGPENALVRAAVRTPATEASAATLAPEAWRNPALGGAAGVVLGLLLAVGAARLDPRGHTDDSVADALGAPVLGSLPGPALAIPFRRRSVAGSSAWDGTVRRLRAHLLLDHRESTSAVVLALTSTQDLPETGRLAVDLGVSLSDGGARVLLVDCNLRTSRMADQLGLDPTAAGDLGHYLDGADSGGGVVQRHSSGVDVILGRTSSSSEGDAEELLLSPSFVTLLDDARSRYDVVLLPTPGTTAGVDALVVAARCDGVLLVTRRQTRGSRLREAAEQLRSSGATLRGAIVLP